MVTFHEIRRIIQKMAVLSSHIVQLNKLLPQVIHVSEKIDSLNDDLTLERDRMTAKIRSVEVLGEILKTHVYKNAPSTSLDQPCQETNTTQDKITSDESLTGNATTDSGAPKPTMESGNQGFYIPNLDGSSMIL